MSPPRTRIWKWGLPEPPSARVSSTRPASTPYFFKDMAAPLRLAIRVLPSTRGEDDGTDGRKASSRRRHGGDGVRLSAGALAKLGSNARDQRRVDVADGDRETYRPAPATEPGRVVGARDPGLSTMSPPCTEWGREARGHDRFRQHVSRRRRALDEIPPAAAHVGVSIAANSRERRGEHRRA